MDTRTLHDHAWDALVSGAEAGATTAAAADGAAATIAGAPTETSAGFQVLSLEQYAASHARSMHRVDDR